MLSYVLRELECINANNIFPANFIYDNLTIQSNIIHNAFLSDVKKLIFLGSSWIYPKHANQPIKESYLLNGPLEKHKRGICNCKNYRC